MSAFLNPQPLLLCRNGYASRTNRCRPRASLQEEPARPRFSRDNDDPSIKPATSFFPQPPAQTTAPTPNDRVLLQVRETMERLGVKDDSDSAAPRPFKAMDISRVNPLSAFAGAAGAAAMSYGAWVGLGYIVAFFTAHPLDDNIYVVQRISAVVRTVLVCLFALGSGVSGVTGLGLLMLGFRTSFAAVTGEYRDK